MDFEEDEEPGGLGLIQAIAEFRTESMIDKWPELFKQRQKKEFERIQRWKEWVRLFKESPKICHLRIVAHGRYVYLSIESRPWGPGGTIKSMCWPLDSGSFDYSV